MAGIIDSKMTPYEKLLLLLPGFKGYKERDIIKQDDAIVRQAIRLNIEKLMDKLKIREEEISKQNPFDETISTFEEIFMEGRTFVQELTGAPTGTFNFHDRYKMDVNILNQILQYDFEIISESKNLAEQYTENLKDILKNLRYLRDMFNKRMNLFLPPEVR